MAVYTKLSKEDFINILSEYKLGIFHSYKEITEGVENSNYFLETTEGKFILTIFEKRTEKEHIPDYINLINYYHNNGIASAHVIPQKSGEFIINIKDKMAIISNFIEENGSCTNSNEELLYNLGVEIKKIHKLKPLKTFNLKNNWGLEKVISLNKLLQEKYFKESDKEYKELLSKSLKLVESHKYKKIEKETIIHGDIFKDNVFVSGNKISGIIDFYFSCKDNYLYDIAVIIIAWCFENEDSPKDITLNKNFIDKFLEGYNSIKADDMDNMIDFNSKKDLQFFTLQAALRFFCTRIFDKFNYNKTSNVKLKSTDEYYYKIIILYNNLK